MDLLNYETHTSVGTTEWIILIHGAGGSIQTWNYQIPALKEKYNLLLLDLRDHGRSKHIKPAFRRYTFDLVTQDILNVLDKNGIRSAHFVTLSFGSVVMQALYRRRPELVRKMVFIGGVFNADLRIKAFVHLARFLNVFLSYERMYQIFSYLLIPKKEHQLARRVYQRQARMLGVNEYLKWLGLYSEFFLLLKSFQDQPINNPILILMGEDDYLFLPSARRFNQGREHSQLYLIPNAGHICNIDVPEETNEAILTFLSSPKIQAETPVTNTPRGTY